MRACANILRIEAFLEKMLRPVFDRAGHGQETGPSERYLEDESENAVLRCSLLWRVR